MKQIKVWNYFQVFTLHLVAVHGNFQYLLQKGVTLGVAKSTIRCIPERKQCTGELINSKSEDTEDIYSG